MKLYSLNILCFYNFCLICFRCVQTALLFLLQEFLIYFPKCYLTLSTLCHDFLQKSSVFPHNEVFQILVGEGFRIFILPSTLIQSTGAFCSIGWGHIIVKSHQKNANNKIIAHVQSSFYNILPNHVNLSF